MSRPGSSRTAAIAAIDFGTTGTGLAYYLRRPNDKNISVMDINVVLETSTTVLMKPDKTFDSFGESAESKYENEACNKTNTSWYYFRHFKMTLHHEQDLNVDVILKEKSGKQMKAITVFAEAIKYLKKELMRNIAGYNIEENDVTWVITVPAIWRDSAKQFMREAANLAGIEGTRLKLALEPESAAVYCKEQAMTRVDNVDGAFIRAFNPKEKYIVVDCGGGTVDTTCHEVQKDGKLNELYAATGGPWGGELVNKAFIQLMEKMLTKEVITEYCSKHASHWIDFEKRFEREKCNYSTERQDVRMILPSDIDTIFKTRTKKDLEGELLKGDWPGKVEIKDKILFFKPKAMDTMFQSATNEISKLIRGLLKKEELNGVSTLLLVGGFSESPLVSKAVKDAFPMFRVIVPPNARNSILKGAVMFGNDPDIIALRISPYSYGVHTRVKYNPKRHVGVKVVKVGNRDVVDNAFDRHLKVGQPVYIAQKSSEKHYKGCINAKQVFWKVYQSHLEDPILCDENCRYIGRLSVDIPVEMQSKSIRLSLTMTCIGSELEAKVFAEEGKRKIECTLKLDFLNTDMSMGEPVQEQDF